MTRFEEKRHRWAIDTGDGKLVGLLANSAEAMASIAGTGVGSGIYGNRRTARAYLRLYRASFPDARIVKVRVSYEVVG